MTRRKHQDAQLDEYLKGSSALTRAYRKTAPEQPPRELDAFILDEAAKAVKPRGGFSPFGSRWSMPLAAAAMVVLSVGLVMFMSQHGVGPDSAGPSAPAESVTTPAGKEAVREMPAPQSNAEPAREKRRAVADQETLAQTPPAASTPVVVQEKAALSKLGAAVKPARADVIAVETGGASGAYQLNVTIMSPDTGCAQYADWWEVVGEDGRLLYRRVLAHSHADEQPFARSGGPVPIQPDTVVWVRAHMHPGGYGGQAMKGSITSGFRSEELRADFAAALAKQSPLPDGCAF
jgi:hypothetical protein